jgi:hypothetical protein
METQQYQIEEQFRVELLELRRKFDKMISDLVDKRDENRIQKMKGRIPGGSVRLLPVDDLPEDPSSIGARDTGGGPERNT